jgi:hypothetical protein
VIFAWILSARAKKLANLCHTIDNWWFAWKGNEDQNNYLYIMYLQTWPEQCG